MIKAAIAPLAALLVLTGCMTDEPELMGARGERLDREAWARANDGQPVQQATAEQNGTTLRLPVGGTLTVALQGNRTTGYFWAVASKPDQLETTGEDYVQDPAPEGMVGVGGTEKFTFRALRRGQGRLRLEQRGAGNRGVAETWEATVDVQ